MKKPVRILARNHIEDALVRLAKSSGQSGSKDASEMVLTDLGMCYVTWAKGWVVSWVSEEEENSVRDISDTALSSKEEAEHFITNHMKAIGSDFEIYATCVGMCGVTMIDGKSYAVWHNPTYMSEVELRIILAKTMKDPMWVLGHAETESALGIL